MTNTTTRTRDRRRAAPMGLRARVARIGWPTIVVTALIAGATAGALAGSVNL